MIASAVVERDWQIGRELQISRDLRWLIGLLSHHR